jgi:hypothetical protein
VLVGNKIDLRGSDVTNQNLEDEIIPIMNEFKVKMIQQLSNFVTTLSDRIIVGS